MARTKNCLQIDIGTRFGRLVVEGFGGQDSHRNRFWNCRCDCGEVVQVPGSSLVSNRSRTCGCRIRKERDAGHAAGMVNKFLTGSLSR